MSKFKPLPHIFGSPEPKLKAHKVSLKDGSLAGVRVCVFTLSNMNISVTSGPIATKFYPHHRGWGKAALGFGPDRIGILVSVATDIFDRIFFILAGDEDIHNVSDEFEIRPDQTKVSCP